MCTCTQDMPLWQCCTVRGGCFWSSLSSQWDLYHSTKYLFSFVFLSKMNIFALYRINFFLSLSLSLTVGLGRERPLWWGISVHRQPPRAAPSSRENRGHRRLTAPLLPVSRLITACHICTITHTHIWACRQMYSSTQPCTLGDLFISQRAICANQNVESSSERFVIIS